MKMIKICGESINVPLKIIFEQSLKEKEFSELRKKTNIVPVDKKRGQKPNKKLSPSQFTFF